MRGDPKGGGGWYATVAEHQSEVKGGSELTRTEPTVPMHLRV